MWELIRAGNVSASVALGGAIIGFAIGLAIHFSKRARAH